MNGIILPHGHYQELESYKNSVIIFDATQKFCTAFLRITDRTTDQMIQAARSGKQNIVEGTMASAVSSETEIKLLGVARASFEELLEDYRDYLRTHDLHLWTKDDPRILRLRQLSRQKDRTYRTYESYFDTANRELFCNTVISLIHQTNFLLDRQLKHLENSFANSGGVRERMYRTRVSVKNQQTEKALGLLRSVYSTLMSRGDSELAHKIEEIAQCLKNQFTGTKP